LKEEHRLRVLRIFGPKRDEVTGEWRKLHNKELNDLYSTPNIVRVIKWRRKRWTGHVAHMGKKRHIQERDYLGDPGVNERMDLQEVRCEGMDWIELAQDRDRWRALVNVVMNCQVP
jgi:hypothetical protein